MENDPFTDFKIVKQKAVQTSAKRKRMQWIFRLW
jgi:hypothetical protein